MEVSWLHLVPLLPLVGAAVCGIAGRWLPKAWVYAVALVSVLLSFLLGLRGFFELGEQTQLLHEVAFNWFSAGCCTWTWASPSTGSPARSPWW